MDPKTISRTFGVYVKAHNSGQGFVSWYWAPGLTPGITRDTDGSIQRFETEEQAYSAGSKKLIEILNIPRVRAYQQSGKLEKYAKLTGPELADLLAGTGITATLATYILGTNEKRFFQWIDGKNEKGQDEAPPHHVRIILELLKANPDNIDIAQAVTDAVTSKRSVRSHQVEIASGT
jgi:hypothetical protein